MFYSILLLIHSIASYCYCRQWVRSRTSGRIFGLAKKMSHSLLINSLPWSGCLRRVSNCHSCRHSSKLPTFSPLSKNVVNCEMAVGNPIGSLEMIGPFYDAYFSPHFHCLNAAVIREPFSSSALITDIWGGEFIICFVFFNDFKIRRSLCSQLIYYYTDILAMSMITCVVVKTVFYYEYVRIIVTRVNQNLINSFITSRYLSTKHC